MVKILLIPFPLSVNAVLEEIKFVLAYWAPKWFLRWLSQRIINFFVDWIKLRNQFGAHRFDTEILKLKLYRLKDRFFVQMYLSLNKKLRSVKASFLSVMQFIWLKQNLFPLVLMEIYFVKVSITTKQILRRFFLLSYPRTKAFFYPLPSGRRTDWPYTHLIDKCSKKA